MSKNPQAVQVNSKEVVCPHCGNTTFLTYTVVLNRALLAFLDMEAFSRKGTALVCSECGLKQEFYKVK